MESLYNLLAEIVLMIKSSPEDKEPQCLELSYEQELIDHVRGILNPWREVLYRAAVIGLPREAYGDILAKIREENNYYSCRILLCEIDANFLVDWEQIVTTDGAMGFASLNTNVDTTGVLILPKVSGPKTTRRHYDEDQNEELVPRKTANEWNDNLNELLGSFYYVLKQDLGDYTLRNYVCDFAYNDTDKKELKVGLSPLWNLPSGSLLKYNDNIVDYNEAGDKCRYFGEIEINKPEEVLMRFRQSFKLACENNVDIFMCPEMLGVQNLYDIDSCGFNDEMHRLSKEEKRKNVPQLTIAPTLWKNNSNLAHVYLHSGRMLCAQYKQHKYRLNGKDGARLEHLKDAPKEICIIHVPQWGRITIPICIDFIYEAYRGLLVKILKTDILLCPSFSSGQKNFLQAIDSYAEFGVYAIWLNACSALSKCETDVPKIVGAACAPTVSSKSRIERLTPTCNGACQGCLFVVTIPLNCMGEEPYEDVGVTVVHISA